MYCVLNGEHIPRYNAIEMQVLNGEGSDNAVVLIG